MNSDLFTGEYGNTIMALPVDGGVDATKYGCDCGWESEWLMNGCATIEEIKEGIPCPVCNKLNDCF